MKLDLKGTSKNLGVLEQAKFQNLASRGTRKTPDCFSWLCYTNKTLEKKDHRLWFGSI